MGLTDFLSAPPPPAFTRPDQARPPEETMRIFAARSTSYPSIDAVAAATGLGPPQVSAALMGLELKKLLQKRADGTFEARS